jgi:N-acetylmuramic acid 6-phosphate etherase
LAKKKEIFEQLARLMTEQSNPASARIDRYSIREIVKTMNNEDKKVAAAVEKQLPFVSRAVEMVVKSFKSGGRLIYIGAGTSGRLGVLDAVECPPTFGSKSTMVQGLIAGSKKAMFRAQEGAEDKEENGSCDVDKMRVTEKDVVCGIAASLRTPYVIGGVRRAKQRGAHTLFITTNPRANLALPQYKRLAGAIDVAICPEVGPEVITGSTRLKSGTAQKLVLNMITTAAMIRLGKVYGNLMVDLQSTNAKLRERAKRIVMTIAGVSYGEAARQLAKAGGSAKVALVMHGASVTAAEAKRRLAKAGGFVRAAIEGKASQGRERR